MPVDEFAARVGRSQRQTSLDRGYFLMMPCSQVNPLSIEGADGPIPLAVSKGYDWSGVQVGSDLIVMKAKNKMVALGYM